MVNKQVLMTTLRYNSNASMPWPQSHSTMSITLTQQVPKETLIMRVTECYYQLCTCHTDFCCLL